MGRRLNGKRIKVESEHVDESLIQMSALLQYRVVLHNDDVNSAGKVVWAIVRYIGLSPEQAEDKMTEAHLGGSTVLKVCHLELAELHQRQFLSQNLAVTVHRDLSM